LSVTETLLRPLLSSSARPLITHYDDNAGTRVELSVATMANWAAKTANWLTDEFDVEPGTPIAVRLPAHWQTAGVLLGAWWCGAQVTDDPASAAVAFVAPGEAALAAARDAAAIAVVSLHPMGADLGSATPHGALDYIAESRIHGDDFLAITDVPSDTPAMLGSSVAQTIEAARARAAELDLTSASRLMSTVEWTLPDGVLSGLLAVLAAGASLVQCTTDDAEVLAARRKAERTTVDLLAGVPVD
jgi:uncharacterized protein (TIGR03089 family)